MADAFLLKGYAWKLSSKPALLGSPWRKRFWVVETRTLKTGPEVYFCYYQSESSSSSVKDAGDAVNVAEIISVSLLSQQRLAFYNMPSFSRELQQQLQLHRELTFEVQTPGRVYFLRCEDRIETARLAGGLQRLAALAAGADAVAWPSGCGPEPVPPQCVLQARQVAGTLSPAVAAAHFLVRPTVSSPHVSGFGHGAAQSSLTGSPRSPATGPVSITVSTPSRQAALSKHLPDTLSIGPGPYSSPGAGEQASGGQQHQGSVAATAHRLAHISQSDGPQDRAGSHAARAVPLAHSASGQAVSASSAPTRYASGPVSGSTTPATAPSTPSTSIRHTLSTSSMGSAGGANLPPRENVIDAEEEERKFERRVVNSRAIGGNIIPIMPRPSSAASSVTSRTNLASLIPLGQDAANTSYRSGLDVSQVGMGAGSVDSSFVSAAGNGYGDRPPLARVSSAASRSSSVNTSILSVGQTVNSALDPAAKLSMLEAAMARARDRPASGGLHIENETDRPRPGTFGYRQGIDDAPVSAAPAGSQSPEDPYGQAGPEMEVRSSIQVNRHRRPGVTRPPGGPDGLVLDEGADLLLDRQRTPATVASTAPQAMDRSRVPTEVSAAGSVERPASHASVDRSLNRTPDKTSEPVPRRKDVLDDSDEDEDVDFGTLAAQAAAKRAAQERIEAERQAAQRAHAAARASAAQAQASGGKEGDAGDDSMPGRGTPLTASRSAATAALRSTPSLRPFEVPSLGEEGKHSSAQEMYGAYGRAPLSAGDKGPLALQSPSSSVVAAPSSWMQSGLGTGGTSQGSGSEGAGHGVEAFAAAGPRGHADPRPSSVPDRDAERGSSSKWDDWDDSPVKGPAAHTVAKAHEQGQGRGNGESTVKAPQVEEMAQQPRQQHAAVSVPTYTASSRSGSASTKAAASTMAMGPGVQVDADFATANWDD